MNATLKENQSKKAAKEISNLTGDLLLKTGQVKMVARVLDEYVSDMEEGPKRDILSGASQALYDLDDAFSGISEKIDQLTFKLEPVETARQMTSPDTNAEKPPELLHAIEDDLNYLQGYAHAVLVAMHADDEDGEDEKETRQLANGRYTIMWEMVPKIIGLAEKIEADILKGRNSELRG